MKSIVMKRLLVLTLLVPLLGVGGCWHDDDDYTPQSPPVSDGGGDNGGGGGDDGGDGGTNEPDPNSISSIFSQPAEGDPIEIGDPDALRTDIETNFGISSDDAREPGEVLDLSSEA